MSDDARPYRSNPTKYVRLAEDVRMQIANGTLQSGQHIPSITELSLRYGWAWQTCGRALRLLEKEGLLIRYPGLGYHVARVSEKSGSVATATAETRQNT